MPVQKVPHENETNSQQRELLTIHPSNNNNNNSKKQTSTSPLFSTTQHMHASSSFVHHLFVSNLLSYDIIFSFFFPKSYLMLSYAILLGLHVLPPFFTSSSFVLKTKSKHSSSVLL